MGDRVREVGRLGRDFIEVVGKAAAGLIAGCRVWIDG
jgi:hypothetical protein